MAILQLPPVAIQPGKSVTSRRGIVIGLIIGGAAGALGGGIMRLQDSSGRQVVVSTEHCPAKVPSGWSCREYNDGARTVAVYSAAEVFARDGGSP
jgi:hypothetical protein